MAQLLLALQVPRTADQAGLQPLAPGLTWTPFGGFALALTRAHSRSRILS